MGEHGRTVRLGIIGAGLAVKWLHWPALEQMPERFQIVAVADVRPEAAQEVATLVGGCRQYADYHDLLADDAVEAVLISVPIHLNAQLLMESVQAGKHTICEKPVAANLVQGQAVVAALTHAPVVAMVAEHFHYRADVTQARQWIADGRIGTVFLVDVACHYWMDITQGFATTPWRHDSQYRGGMITDAAIHHAALLRELGGEMEQLQAFTKLLHPALSGVDTIILNARYRSGALGRLLYTTAARAAQTPFTNAMILGTEGTIWLTDGLLRLARPEEPEVTWTGDARRDNGYYGEFVNFHEAITAGAPVVSTPAEALRDLAILMRALDSAEARSVELL